MSLKSLGGAAASVALVLSMTAACGGSDDSSKSNSGAKELTVVLPAPSGIAFYPLLVAEENGYYGDDLRIKVETADGSTAALQQVLSGQADVCLCSPGPALAGADKGSPIESIYTLYQSDVFSLVTEAGSDVTTAEDLRGKTIGVDTRGAGAESWAVSLLAESGLEEGDDYEIIATGAGAAPITAFRKSEIDAYAAAFIDVASMEARGVETSAITLPGSEDFFDSMLVIKKELAQDSPELVEALGRGVAMGTIWGEDNPDGVLDVVEKTFPEEVADETFALALLEQTVGLFTLPDGADGQWGFQVPERYETLTQSLIDQGQIEAAPEDFFSNEFIPQFNEFSEDELS